MLWLWCMLSWAQVATVDGVPITESEFAVRARAFSRFTVLDLRARKHVVDELVDERLFAMRALEVGVQNDAAMQRLIVRTWHRRNIADAAEHITDDELRAWWDARGADPFPGLPADFDARRGLVQQAVAEERLEARRQRWMKTLRADAGIVVDKRFLQLHGPLPFKVRKAKLGGPMARIGDEPVTELPPQPPTRHGELPMLDPERLANYIDERLIIKAAMSQPLLEIPEVRRNLADTWLEEEIERRVEVAEGAERPPREVYDRALEQIRTDVRREVEIVVDEGYLMRVPVKRGALGVRRPPLPLPR